MSFVKINTDDLILACHYEQNDVYTLVCRADINRPDTWNYIPSMDMVRFDMSGNERQLYITGLKQVMRIQETKYPKIKEIKQRLQPEIDKFHQTLDAVYNTKTK